MQAFLVLLLLIFSLEGKAASFELAELPRRPPSAEPQGSAWRNSVAVCVTIRDESVPSVRLKTEPEHTSTRCTASL